LDHFKQLHHDTADRRILSRWMPHLPAAFRESGLEGIKVDVRDAPPRIAFPMHQIALLVAEIFIRQGVYSESARDLLAEAEKESGQGSFWTFTRMAVIGRKQRTCIE
jgi:hypothetical protein